MPVASPSEHSGSMEVEEGGTVALRGRTEIGSTVLVGVRLQDVGVGAPEGGKPHSVVRMNAQCMKDKTGILHPLYKSLIIDLLSEEMLAGLLSWFQWNCLYRMDESKVSEGGMQKNEEVEIGRP